MLADSMIGRCSRVRCACCRWGLSLRLARARWAAGGNVEKFRTSTTYYVTDTLKIESTASEAFGYGFDLTNDANFRPNNVLGTTLAGLWPVHW